MAINVYQVNSLMSGMFGSDAAPTAGVYASEFPLIADNFNNNLSRYTYLMGVWTSSDLNSNHTVGNASWTQDVGSRLPWRANNGYYVRSVVFTNEANYWGYIASLQGGYRSLAYNFDSLGSTVDYDGKLLGHGTVTGYPMPFTSATQFRDSNNLPADGTSVITSTGSAYTRSRYLPPCYFTVYVTTGGTIGSGNIRFIVDQRPSHTALAGSRSVNSDYYGDIFTATNSRNLNRRRLSIFMGRIYTGATDTMYAFPLEEDGTNVGGSPMGTVYAADALDPVTGMPATRSTGDQRVRHHAMFNINEEYYGLVHETHAAIFSNKTSTIPLVFFDLADTWGSSRIAGVTVNQAKNKIYFLAEDGHLAVYDFTVAGGQISALATAPALAAGEAYGAMSLSSDGTKLYVLNGCFSADPKVQTAGTGRIGVVAYTIGSNTWGASNDSALLGRHNTRSLGEIITLRSGKLAMLVESVTVGGGNVTNAVGTANNNIQWQLMIHDPALGTWNTNAITATNTLNYGTDVTRWMSCINATLVDVASGKLLINTNWKNNALWICDVSGAAASVDDTKLTAIGKGQANDIFPVGVTAAKVQIRKSLTEDRTIFWHSEANAFSSSNAVPPIYMAPPSFTWTSGTLSTISSNTKSNGNVTGFNKDMYSTTDCFSGHGSGTPDMYSFLTYFTGSFIGLSVLGGVYNGGEYGRGSNSLYADHNSHAIVYLPTYWKQVAGNPVMADSWADAAASPFAVPNTPGTDINLPYGLKVQFTPSAGTSFATGDWHVMNVTYGSIKYQRKSRFAWAMFAGQTFQATQTKTLAALNAIKPSIVDGNWTVSTTGPQTITTINYYRTMAQWPKVVTGTAQNTAAVMEITTSSSPDPSTLINVPGDGKVVTADNQANGAASNAFNGNPDSFWRTNVSGAHYIQIDMGAPVTANSYALRFNASTMNETPASWILKGSATGAFSGEEVTIDTQTAPSPLYTNHAFNIATPGSYRYYRLVTAGVGGNYTQLGSLRFFTAILTNSVNFSEIVFGSGWERGLKFEVDTGAGYVTITPLWRSHNGNIWCFARQVGVQKIRITVQHGANQYSGNTPTGNAAMGNFTFIDWGTQTQMDAARLGNAGVSDGDPARGSFDTQCLGIASDAVTISIDGDSPISRTPYGSNNMIWSQYDWVTVPANQYKVHPFWGFVLLPGAGGSQAASTQTGTNLTITYNWGRRV